VTNASTVIDEFDDVFDPEPVDLARLDSFGDRLTITRGTESPRLLIAVAEELERLLPGADHPVLEGTGHIPYRTHPEMWYRVVLDQIRSL
jgi:pimeloyl-ACP methyl ester carboxylesterase